MKKLFFGLILLVVVPGFSATGEGSLPLFFVQNSGMGDASVRYFVQTAETQAAFAAGSVTFRIGGEQVQVRFAGADLSATLQGIEPLAARANFFLGQGRD